MALRQTHIGFASAIFILEHSKDVSEKHDNDIIMYFKYIEVSFNDNSGKYKLTMEDVKMYQKEKLDMGSFGKAVKTAREGNGWTREKLAEILGLSPRYIMYIEMRGQHPSLQKLYEIATIFNISIDQFFFPNAAQNGATCRRQLDAMLDGMDEKELYVITETAKAMREVKKIRE